MRKRILLLAAAALVALAAPAAQAGFSFVGTPNYATSTDMSATLTLGAATSGTGLDAPTLITFGNPTVTSTATTLETLSLPFSYTVTITNPSIGGTSADIIITGTISGTASATQSHLTTIVFGGGGSTGDLNGTTFTVTGITGTPPQTTNTVGTGSLVASVTATTTMVPEPASMSLALLGLGGLGVVRVLRRKARA